MRTTFVLFPSCPFVICLFFSFIHLPLFVLPLRIQFSEGFGTAIRLGWLSSRVVSVLDSGAEGPGVQIAVATLSGDSLRQTVHTRCASVHQAAKLVAALLRAAGVTADLAESNGSLPPGL